MTIFSVLGWLFKTLGLVQWAASMYEKHEIVIKAQEVANAPISDEEEHNYWTKPPKS